MDLQEARKKIDSIDAQMVALFEKRLEAILDIAKYKEKNNLKIFDAAREEEVIQKNLALIEEEKDRIYVEEFIKKVMEICRKYEKQHMQQHIFLIGMPGSGKTTVGRALSQQLGMDFYDVDALIQEKTGKSIQNIIIYDGEPQFRKYEYEVISDIVKSRPSIIATGGGTVLSEETNQLMRESGIVVFLQRDVTQILDDLDMEIRPLMKESIEYIFRLYKERYPLYERVSHIKIENASNISDTIEAIVAALPKNDI